MRVQSGIGARTNAKRNERSDQHGRALFVQLVGNLHSEVSAKGRMNLCASTASQIRFLSEECASDPVTARVNEIRSRGRAIECFMVPYNVETGKCLK